MEEFSILIIEEIAGSVFKKPHKIKKSSDSNVCQRSINLYFTQLVK